jgi:pimeloyl-ACP methyl ester carboxylesterase
MNLERLKFIKKSFDDSRALYKKDHNWDQALSLFKKRFKRAYKAIAFPDKMLINGSNSDLYRDEIKGYLGVMQEIRVQSQSRLNWYKGERVWIVTHGFSDCYDHDFLKISDGLQKEYPEDLVFGLDWSTIANGLSPAESNDVCRAATWIRPIAKELFVQLEAFGVSDPSKLCFVGHSLGTLLLAELARIYMEKYSEPCAKIIALDPPSESAMASYVAKQNVSGALERAKHLLMDQNNQTIPYLVQLEPQIKRVESFKLFFKDSLSLLGNNSIAGSPFLARTCSKTILVKFNTFLELRKGHSWLVTLLAQRGLIPFETMVLQDSSLKRVNSKTQDTLDFMKKVAGKGLDALPFDIDKSHLKQEVNQKMSETFAKFSPIVGFVTLDHEFNYIYDASDFKS